LGRSPRLALPQWNGSGPRAHIVAWPRAVWERCSVARRGRQRRARGWRRRDACRGRSLGGGGLGRRARGEHRLGIVDAGGRLLEIPNEADPRERLEDQVRDVELPPEETLARGAHVIVVVVVPALAERE